jgi:hypothetical protein
MINARKTFLVSLIFSLRNLLQMRRVILLLAMSLHLVSSSKDWRGLKVE